MKQPSVKGKRVVSLRLEELAYLLGLRAFSRAIRQGKRDGVRPAARKWEGKFAAAIKRIRSARPGCGGS